MKKKTLDLNKRLLALMLITENGLFFMCQFRRRDYATGRTFQSLWFVASHGYCTLSARAGSYWRLPLAPFLSKFSITEKSFSQILRIRGEKSSSKRIRVQAVCRQFVEGSLQAFWRMLALFRKYLKCYRSGITFCKQTEAMTAFYFIANYRQIRIQQIRYFNK